MSRTGLCFFYRVLFFWKKKYRKQPNSKGAFADFRCFPISASVFPELHKMYIQVFISNFII